MSGHHAARRGRPVRGDRHELHPKGACEECQRLGWAVFNVDTDPEVQRCDNCAAIPTDEAARAHARACRRAVSTFTLGQLETIAALNFL